MTWDQLAVSGRGRVDYCLEIPGVGVFATNGTVPTGESWWDDNWPSSAYYHNWLHYDLGDIREEISFEEGTIKVANIGVIISDRDSQFSRLLRTEATVHCFGTISLGVANPTIPCDSNAAFAASGYIYAGLEAISYAGIVPYTEFTTTGRGVLGTVAEEHYTDLALSTPTAFRISSHPDTIIGRRAILRASVDGEAWDIIFRGICREDPTYERGVAKFQIEHISKVFKSKFCDNAQKYTIPSGQRCIVPDSDNSKAWFFENAASYINTTVSGAEIHDWCNNVNDMCGGATAIGYVAIEGKTQIWARVTANYSFGFRAVYGDILWSYGFDAGSYATIINGNSFSIFKFDSQRDGERFYIDLSAGGSTASYVNVYSDALNHLEAGEWIQITGNAPVKVQGIDYPNSRISIDATSLEAYRQGGDSFMVAPGDDPIELARCFKFGNGSVGDTMRTAIERIMGFESPLQVDASMCVKGTIATDWDLTELDSVMATVPSSMARVTCEYIEPAPVGEVLTPHLALLGIAPRLTDDGKIGFSRISQPIDVQAISVEVDADMWDLDAAKDASARFDNTSLINRVVVKYQKNIVGAQNDERESEWKGPVKITWREGIDLVGGSRSISYDVPGLQKPESMEYREFLDVLNGQLIGTHFAVFGMPSATHEIQCTWRARQVRCGDVVKITHPTIPDPGLGARGLIGRLGIVVGRRHRLTEQGSDSIIVMVQAENKGVGIGPCAHGDTWDAGRNTLSFSSWDSARYGSPTDLAHFAAIQAEGDLHVRMTTYGSLAPTVWTAECVGVDDSSGELTLSTDPFSGAFPANGVWVALGLYSTSGVEGAGYAWQSSYDPTPLLNGTDEAQEWIV